MSVCHKPIHVCQLLICHKLILHFMAKGRVASYYVSLSQTDTRMSITDMSQTDIALHGLG